MKKFLLVLCIGFFTIQNVAAQKALKVWVVRHAEKITSNPKDKDPELSSEGSVRAEALLKLLKGEKIDSIFTTNFKRTKLTAFPLADKIGLALKMYNSADQKTFAKQLMANAKGKNILIVGHSNTVLEAVEAFGGVKPMAELKDEDYDYIFLLTIKNGKTEVKVERYGAKSSQ